MIGLSLGEWSTEGATNQWWLLKVGENRTWVLGALRHQAGGAGWRQQRVHGRGRRRLVLGDQGLGGARVSAEGEGEGMRKWTLWIGPWVFGHKPQGVTFTPLWANTAMMLTHSRWGLGLVVWMERRK